MSVIQVDGTLTLTPPGSGLCGVPGGALSVPLALSPHPKQSCVSASGARQVSSPSAYVQLSGVGDTDTVTKANTVYLKTNSPMMIKLTFDNSPDADIESEFPLYGIHLSECGDTKYLKKIEVKGSGTVELVASGNQ